MKLYTIGFTKKNARQFFGLLKDAGVENLVDIRLNNKSQLAGFAKRDDLEYFLRELDGITYHHFPNLAPTKDILDGLKKHKGSWESYVRKFKCLMDKRHAIEELEHDFFEKPSCLLCSEATPEHCHRRLVAEAMKKRWPELEIIHL